VRIWAAGEAGALGQHQADGLARRHTSPIGQDDGLDSGRAIGSKSKIENRDRSIARNTRALSAQNISRLSVCGLRSQPT
jgi:hypothetical protein